MKKYRKLLIGASIVVFVVVVALIVGAWAMTNIALDSSGRTVDSSTARYDHEKQAYPQIANWLDSIIQTGALRDTFLTLNSGERAHGIYIRNPQANGRTAVVVHGYRSDHSSMMNIAYLYNHDLGMNVVLPDLHGHGLSDGNDVRMGWKDHLDVIDWAQRMQPVLTPDTVAPRMLLHGLSMGGATVMEASGEDLPDYIKCIVEDCGFSSVHEEFTHEINNSYHLPAFPLLNIASLLTRMRYGWYFGDANAASQVAKSTVPMLFIHGDNDDYVPTEMVYTNYNAKTTGDKRLWLAPGSAHAAAYKDHPEEYTARVADFVASAFADE